MNYKYGEKYLSKQSEVDFINEFGTSEIADWVLLNHLKLFCKENGYSEWKSKKKILLRKKLIDEV